MTHRSLSKKLAVRSDRGYVVAPPETFSIIHLDNRHRVIAWQELFRGTIDGALYLALRLSIALKCL